MKLTELKGPTKTHILIFAKTKRHYKEIKLAKLIK